LVMLITHRDEDKQCTRGTGLDVAKGLWRLSCLLASLLPTMGSLSVASSITTGDSPATPSAYYGTRVSHLVGSFFFSEDDTSEWYRR